MYAKNTHITPIFGVRRIRPNGIISPQYLEVTLDNFSFLVGGCSAARQSVFCPLGWILAIFSNSYLRKESTPDFGPISMKLGRIVRFAKK